MWQKGKKKSRNSQENLGRQKNHPNVFHIFHVVTQVRMTFTQWEWKMFREKVNGYVLEIMNLEEPMRHTSGDTQKEDKQESDRAREQHQWVYAQKREERLQCS